MSKYSTNIWLFVCVLCVTLHVQSCKKDNDDPDMDDTNQPWGDLEHPFPVYTIDNATYVVKADGSLWARGKVFSHVVQSNTVGFIQLETNVKKIANTSSSERLYVLRKDNSVWRTPDYLPIDDTPEFAEQKATEKVTDDAIDVQAGRNFGVILKADGTVWAMGENGSGEFGLGEYTYDELPLTQIATDVKQIATNYSNIYLLKNDNSLWSAGNYIYGKLGYPADKNQLTFKKVMDDVEIVRANANIVMLVKKDRTAWSFGSNVNGTQGIGEVSQNPTYPHQIADGVKDVFPMNFTSFLLKEDNTLWACGSNAFGQMGKETPKQHLNYIQIAENVNYISTVSSSHHIIILQGGKYRMAGLNKFKELEQSTIENFTTFTDFEMP